MNDLTGRVAMVAGGAGAVGEGIVEALLVAGATVAVPSRTQPRLDELRARIGGGAADRLVGILGDIGQPDGAEAVRDQILAERGRLDVVVAAVGGWWSGPPLTGVRLADWQRGLDTLLTPHFVLARTFVPVLARQPGSVYAMVAGDTDVAPVPGASLTTVVASGVMGLQRALAAEAASAGDDVRVLVLHLGPVATRKTKNPDPSWYTAREVGDAVVAVAADPAATGGVLELRARPRPRSG